MFHATVTLGKSPGGARLLRACRRHRWLWLPAGALAAAVASGCGDSNSPPQAAVEHRRQISTPAPSRFDFKPKEQSSNPSAEGFAVLPQTLRFDDQALALGLEHIYDNGAGPKLLMVEATGGGCGWLDFDRDGLFDLYLTQGGVPDAPDPRARPPERLFRQLAERRFHDVALPAGIDEHEYTQGVVAGDFDNDGFTDLYVTAVGRNTLWHNRGDGTFHDLTDELGLGCGVWSSSAAWGDIDRDGDLDLYVCHYVRYDPYAPYPCKDKEGRPAICHPRSVDPEPDEFFENLGDGRFREKSHSLGLFGEGNKALGVAIVDLTNDGWPDIFVANDTTVNFFFVNDGRGAHFHESAAALGGGYSATGQTQANMGIALGDYDGNGYFDLCVSHFTGEYSTLYQNLGPSGLRDVSALTGLRELTRSKLGFGIVMHDFDCEGHMDLFTANGHIDPSYPDAEGYEMAPQLATFDGGRWHDRSGVAGPYFLVKQVGRGVATADFDDDGDLDIAVVHQNTPTALLQNQSQRGAWLKLSFVGIDSNRDATNARVAVTVGTTTLWQELPGGTSYVASHQPCLVFGAGRDEGPAAIEITWPSGLVERLEGVALNQDLLAIEGLGLRPRVPRPAGDRAGPEGLP